MKIVVIVGTARGAFILRSDESRQNWDIEGPLFKGWKATASARDEEGNYLLGTSSFVYGAAVQKSRDLKNWTQLAGAPRYPESSAHKVNQIWTIVPQGSNLHLGVDDAGLFTSADAGASWQEVEGLNGHPTRENWFPGFGGLCAHSLLVDPQSSRMWCGISAVGVFRSDDGGASWHSKNEGVPIIIEDKDHKDIGYCVHALVADPNDFNLIYRQDHKGMFRTSNGGESWQAIESGLPSGFGFPLVMNRHSKALFAFPLESDEYRMPHDGTLAVYKSTDDGGSWSPRRQGLPQSHVYTAVLRCAVASDHLEPGGLYFGTTSGTVHVSRDDGESWTSLPCLLPRILSVEAYLED